MKQLREKIKQMPEGKAKTKILEDIEKKINTKIVQK